MTRDREPGRQTEHAYTEERLSAYLDGQLPPHEREAVEQHLAGCDACRWNLKTLRQTVLWTRNLPTVPVPRSFTIPVPATSRARAAAPRRQLLPAFQWATALVALLLFFAVAGDAVLTGFRPASVPRSEIGAQAPAPQVVETTVVEVTREVQLEVAPQEPAEAVQEAPVAAEPELPMPKAASEEDTPLRAAASPEATAPAAAGDEPETLTYSLPPTLTDAVPPGMGGGLEESTGLAGASPAVTETEAMAMMQVTETVAADMPPLAMAQVTETVVAEMETYAMAQVTETVEPQIEAVAMAQVSETQAADVATDAQETPAPAAAVPTPAPAATAAPAVGRTAPTASPAAPLVAPTEAPLPALTAPAGESLVAPTAVVQVDEAAEPQALDQVQVEESERRALVTEARALSWLRLLEYTLGAAFILLLGTTLVLVLWRRRTR